MKSNFSRQMVLAIFAAFLSAWAWVNWSFLIDNQNGTIRFFLTLILSALIIIRPKPRGSADTASALSGIAVVSFAISGTILTITGIAFGIRQLEWIGILLLTFSCLGFSMPARYRTDIILSVLLLYLAHPMPSRLFLAFQLTMQDLSVSWSEWLLHIFNIRVYADDFVIKHGLNVFEIPQWCSGMRTATTLLILSIGISILKRLRFIESAVFTAFGILQALILNVVRISLMVTVIPDQASEAAYKFLHDTSGIVTITGVLLVYAEISAYTRWKNIRKAGSELPASVDFIISEMPPILRILQNRKGIIILTALLTLLSAGLIYKSRPSHRAEMIKTVAEVLRDHGRLDESLQAAMTVAKLQPEDTGWSLGIARILVMMERYDSALERINAIPGLNDTNSVESKILTAYCMLGKGRTNEAVLIVKSLPEKTRKHDPRTAMVLAEIAFRSNDPDDCAMSAVTASKWPPNSNRIRVLYPYLAVNRKFAEIAKSNTKEPFSDPDQLLAAAEAYMNLNMRDASARLALEAVNKWPADHRILELLYYLAMFKTESEWSGIYSRQLAYISQSTSDIGILYRHLKNCFTLGRADLGWNLFRRIQALDPNHPFLGMSIARYGNDWFKFKKQTIGLKSNSPDETIDIKPLYLLGKRLVDWAPMCSLIPFGDELSATDIDPVRKRFLAKAIAEFANRQATNLPTGMMLNEYTHALEMAGEGKRALTGLKNAEAIESGSALLDPVDAISEIHERNCDWEEVYETLKDKYTPENIGRSKPDLSTMLRFCDSLNKLNLGPAAMYLSLQTHMTFPDSPQAAGNLAAVLAKFDTQEQALFYASRHETSRLHDLDIIEAEALFLTQRYSELPAFCKSVQLPQMLIPDNAPQTSSVRPAEAAALWHYVSLPSEADFAGHAKEARTCLTFSKNPFIRALHKNWLECYEAKCGNGSADMPKWLEIGRNSIEKATALNQLSLLLCHNNRITEAREAAGQAVKYLPQSPLLWRMLISLSGGDGDAITAARKSCRTDPEIWLAEIVYNTQRGSDGKSKWTEQNVVDFLGIQGNRPEDFNVDAAARIAEYLYRGNMDIAASISARSAYARARGWLPACLLGIRCAARDRDRHLAISATLNSISTAKSPSKEMYINLVSAKTSDNILDIDNDMINALKHLRTLDPDNETWAGTLGLIRFKRGGGDMIDAYNQMSTAIEMGTTNITPYIIAAEASHFLGNNDRVLDILKKAIEKHPGNITLINNLAYSTAKSGTKPAEAQKYIPELSKHQSNLTALDTIAYIHMKSGDSDKARSVFAKIISLCSIGTQPWFRARMFLAEMALQEGKKTEAELILKDILQYSRNIKDEDILYANTMMLQIAGSNAPVKAP